MPMRFDMGAMRKPETLENGYLRVDGLLTRTGVFTYRNPDGSTRRELRLPEEVFRKDSLKTFSGNPVTNDHPPDLLDTHNTTTHMKGTLGENVVPEGEHVRGTITVMDADTIDAVKSGKVGLSCGYECDLDWTPGVYNGERYDAVQRNIRGNHVAIVRNPRAGDTARIRMDKDDACMVESSPSIEPGEKPMKKIRIDGVDYEFSEVAAQAFEKFKDAAEKKATDATKRADSAEAARDDLTEKLAAEKVRADSATDPKAFAKAVASRVALEGAARAVLGSKVKFDGLSDREVQIKIITAKSPKFDAKEKSDDYVRARFDSAMESVTVESVRQVRQAVEGRTDADDAGEGEPTEVRTDDADYAARFDEDAARKRQNASSRDGWKQPIKVGANA